MSHQPSADDRGAAPTGVRPHRWVGIAALGVLIGLVCALLGSWQWSRYEDRAAAVDRVTTSYDAPTVPVADLLEPGTPLSLDAEWRPVLVEGRYLTDHTVLLRNRPVSGRPGYHVLVPFQVALPAGSAVLVVDRGWVPGDTQSAAVPEPPAGSVEVTVRLRPNEPASDRDAPAGQVQAIAVGQVLDAGGLTAQDGAVYDAYGILAAEVPAASDRIAMLPRPSTSLGSNLSYALQWWALAAGGVIALGVVAYRERHELRRGADEPPPAPPRRRRRRPTAEEEEDALLDAAQV